MQTDEILQNIIELCRKYSAEEAILFGSRAKGTALERSDFDIAVSGVAEFSLMQEEAWNLPTLFKIDLVNMDTCKNQLLIEDIIKYGKKFTKRWMQMLETRNRLIHDYDGEIIKEYCQIIIKDYIDCFLEFQKWVDGVFYGGADG